MTMGGDISDREPQEMIEIAKFLHDEVKSSIRTNTRYCCKQAKAEADASWGHVGDKNEGIGDVPAAVNRR
jgi:hypothetical protein